MPHMSPMYWSMTFISSSVMLTLIYTNMKNLYSNMMSSTLPTENDLKIKMNWKFIYGLYNPVEMYL